MKSLISFVMTIIILIGGCNTMNNQTVEIDLEKEKEKLLSTDREFAKFSEQNGAAEAFNAYLLPEALQLPNARQPRFGRDTIYAAMSPDDEYELLWEPVDCEVSNNADMGYTWGRYRYTYKNTESEKVESLGKYLNVWKKDSTNNWKVLVDMGNSSPE